MDNSPNINNTLTAGVSPDGLKDSYSIKLLICYLINRYPQLLTPKDIFEISFEQCLANYFEICSVMDELLVNRIVLHDDDETELLTPSADCKAIAESLYADIPFTVREKAVKALDRRFARRRHEEETDITITEVSDGYQITCTLLGPGTPLMSVSLYMPEKKYALEAKERFIDDPEYVYRTLISHLTNESVIAPDPESE